MKWKTLCNKSCISYFIESRTVEFVFFQFFYDFISILQIYCLMRPGGQDLNVNFFTFRSYRQLDGWQAPHPPLGATGTHFLKFPYSVYIFEILFFLNIKMKKRPEGATLYRAGNMAIFAVRRRRGCARLKPTLGHWRCVSSPSLRAFLNPANRYIIFCMQAEGSHWI